MLNPKWLANAPDDIVELWQESEDEALKEIARHISSYDYFTPTALQQKQLLSATGATQKSIIAALSKVSGKSQNKLLKMMQEAGNQVIQDDTGVYKAADIYKASAIDTEALNLVLKQGTQDTLSEFRKIIQQTAVNGSNQVYNCIDRAQMLVSTGVISQEQAVRDAIKTLADHGLDSVVYTDNQGHISQVASLETAVRRAVQTGVNQTAGKISNELADEVGCDLVEVSAHEGARPSHALWQGKIYSRSGNSKKYPKLSTGTGYGKIDGLCGINCRHTFGPWVEGSHRVWSDQELEDLKKPTITYNGKNITEYEASQIQRKIERTIRKWKREKEMLDIAGLDSTEAQMKVQQWRMTSEDFVNQTGLRRQYERENVWSTRSTSTERPKATRENKQKTVAPVVPKVEETKELSDEAKKIVDSATKSGISTLAVESYPEVRTDERIVEEIAGGDMTKGSCASAALTYIGQKSGWDVHDFRDGMSRKFFSSANYLDAIGDLPGVTRISVTAKTDVKAAKQLMEKMETGKMYYFYPGRHAAMVRKLENGTYQYLELQSSILNGWKDFTTTTLNKRFGCRKSQQTFYGMKFDANASMIEADGLIGNSDLKKILEFVNTSPSEQRKGEHGTIK